MLTDAEQRTVLQTLMPYQPKQISVFGSRARGDARPDSDLDLLIDPQADVDLLNLIGLEQELSDRLGMTVHLVTERSLNPRMRSYVMQDLIPIISHA
ncbi:MAG: nucleotidyltransferase family protein [Bacteroidota bacterium]|nr:nucleotidyltransferase family protein [Bacteroidota bacterium]